MGFPKQVIGARLHQNATGSQEVLLYWHVCHGAPEACNLFLATQLGQQTPQKTRKPSTACFAKR
jgi:hypothetical protein